ncbi:MAG: hypothetical protein WC091_06235 [Sulfuricellaceae bacterium]
MRTIGLMQCAKVGEGEGRQVNGVRLAIFAVFSGDSPHAALEVHLSPARIQHRVESAIQTADSVDGIIFVSLALLISRF